MTDINKIIKKWSSILGLESGSTRSNWFEEYSQRTIIGDKSAEEWFAQQPTEDPTQPDPFSTIQFPIVRQVHATTLAGGGWIKSKKQQLKEDRINKLRKLKGKKPNVKLEKDEYVHGLIAVQPLSAPTNILSYIDFKYETDEEKNIKKQKERRKKLEGIDLIRNLQLNIIRKDKLKYIEEIIQKK